ncbi:MAG: Fis family transcriptional regulator [Archangium gephyra]|uniref:Fis family transcriptional regulator n=1 Tax=Archangium gephyra TaxID=48 RepID=A0A2W5VLU2_9BACT|nr:MAG: Fis family transcriptional regulator [Archangium gephyra]
MARILVVDDELSIREYLEVLLLRAGHVVELAESLATASSALQNRGFDLVISDFRIGHDSGIDVLKLARSLPSPPEVILITAYGTPASAVEAMRQGAYDYISKPFDNEELLLLIERAVEKSRLREENRQLRQTLVPRAEYFIGTSPLMRNVWTLVDKVAQAKSTTVLITGESGTGKEVVARAVHNRSPRAAAPFVPINCGAIAEGLLESELFGHVKGAFTGAQSDRVGILVSAGEGTVLLDEVGELPLGTQVKLLRVLQERRVKPVGSSREIPFEARVLAATNRRLDEEVKAGRFREDLFFRLNVINVDLPPLRARREDIRPLATFFLGRVAEELGRPGLRFTEESLKALEAYAFSGNVRQLHNLVERAATLSDSDSLGLDSLPPAVSGVSDSASSADVQIGEKFSLERHLDEVERRFLQEALRRSGGVKMRAAELLGLTFRSLRYRLAKQGLGDREDA